MTRTKNFPSNERYEVLDSRGALNSRKGNWKENHTYVPYSKTAGRQKQGENHIRIHKESYIIFKGTTINIRIKSSIEKMLERRPWYE